MTRWAMTVKAVLVASVLAVSGEAAAATIFGIIQRDNQPVANTPVVLTCGEPEALTINTNTDGRGTYRLTTDRTGRCMLQVYGASAEVILYRDPTRYDFEIEGRDGQTRLIRR